MPIDRAIKAIPLQQDGALPQEHAERAKADDGPEDACWHRTGVDDTWNAMHGCDIGKLMEHTMDIFRGWHRDVSTGWWVTAVRPWRYPISDT